MPVLTIDKILQSQGLGTRKTCQKLIHAGQVYVSDLCITDHKATFDTDNLRFTVAGDSFDYAQHVLIALYKPVGYECSHQPSHHLSVYSLLPDYLINRKAQCVGRLDQDTSGLLLFTDNGQLLHKLSHPKHHIAKRYTATLSQPLTDTALLQLAQGVHLRQEGERVFVAHQLQQHVNQLQLTIYEGIYHQVKRMIAAVGGHVDALERNSIGAAQLSTLHNKGKVLAEGEYCYLPWSEIENSLLQTT